LGTGHPVLQDLDVAPGKVGVARSGFDLGVEVLDGFLEVGHPVRKLPDADVPRVLDGRRGGGHGRDGKRQSKADEGVP
jgi:hypothetical protein